MRIFSLLIFWQDGGAFPEWREKTLYKNEFAALRCLQRTGLFCWGLVIQWNGGGHCEAWAFTPFSAVTSFRIASFFRLWSLWSWSLSPSGRGPRSCSWSWLWLCSCWYSSSSSSSSCSSSSSSYLIFWLWLWLLWLIFFTMPHIWGYSGCKPIDSQHFFMPQCLMLRSSVPIIIRLNCLG